MYPWLQVPSYRSASPDPATGEDFARAMESMEVQRLQAEVRFLRDQLDLEKAEGDKWLLVSDHLHLNPCFLSHGLCWLARVHPSRCWQQESWSIVSHCLAAFMTPGKMHAALDLHEPCLLASHMLPLGLKCWCKLSGSAICRLVVPAVLRD